MSVRIGSAVIFTTLVLACGGADSPQAAAIDPLHDGQQLHCVASSEAGLPLPPAPNSAGGLDRISPEGFRARYLVMEQRAVEDVPSMTALVVFGHTIPLFRQVHFPPPVEEPALTFLRTEPSVFMLFQLDPWQGDTARFTWVERREDMSFMASGRCRPV